MTKKARGVGDRDREKEGESNGRDRGREFLIDGRLFERIFLASQIPTISRVCVLAGTSMQLQIRVRVGWLAFFSHHFFFYFTIAFFKF